jgi:hypothetical protein
MINTLSTWIEKNPGKMAIITLLFVMFSLGIAGEADYQEAIKQEQR